MRILTPEEKSFLTVFLHEATTSPFTGPATKALHEIGVEYGDIPYITRAYEQEVPRTSPSYELGHSAAAAPPLPWTNREAALRRNREIASKWKQEPKQISTAPRKTRRSARPRKPGKPVSTNARYPQIQPGASKESDKGIVGLTPWTIFQAALKALPPLKFALGVLGLVSAIAIIMSFRIDVLVAVFGTILMVVLMTALVVFAALTRVRSPQLATAAHVMMWAFILLVIFTPTFLFTSVFFDWPLALRPRAVVPAVAIESPQQLIHFYRGLESYQDKSTTTITLPDRAHLDINSDVFYERLNNKFRANSELVLYNHGAEKCKANYQVFAEGGKVYIHDVDKREYIIIEKTSLNVQERDPENEPIKQFALTVLKPYQFLVNTDEAGLLSLIRGTAPTVTSPDKTELRWTEVIPSLDKWVQLVGGPDLRNNPPNYKIPIKVEVDKRGLVVRSTAELRELISFLSRVEILRKRLGLYSLILNAPDPIVADTTYSDIMINKRIPQAYFTFHLENAKLVEKLSNPLTDRCK